MSESTASEPAANLLEDRLDPVRELGDRLQADHRRGTLEAVGGPERLVQMRTVPLAALQIHQPFFQADEQLARLLEEHLAEAVVRTRQDRGLSRSRRIEPEQPFRDQESSLVGRYWTVRRRNSSGTMPGICASSLSIRAARSSAIGFERSGQLRSDRRAPRAELAQGLARSPAPVPRSPRTRPWPRRPSGCGPPGTPDPAARDHRPRAPSAASPSSRAASSSPASSKNISRNMSALGSPTLSPRYERPAKPPGNSTRRAPDRTARPRRNASHLGPSVIPGEFSRLVRRSRDM